MRSMPDPARGDVVRVRLDPTEGSGQGGERPALVLSPTLINERSPVILIAAITSRKADRVYPFAAPLQPPEGGLTLPSKVLLMQLRSVDKRRLVGRYGAISEEAMGRVEEALRAAMGFAGV